MPAGRPRKYGPTFKKSLAGKTGEALAKAVATNLKKGRKRKGVKLTANTLSVPKGLTTVFPTRKDVRFDWTYAGGLDSGIVQSSFGVANQMWLNAVNDPLASGGVNRPHGYDTYAAIYGKYKVFSCKVHVTISNPINTTTPANGADGMVIGIRAHKDGSTDGIFGEKYASADMKRWTAIKYLNDTGKQVTSFSRTYNIAALDGLTPAQIRGDIDQYSAIMASNPNKKPYFEVAIANSESAENYRCAVTVKLSMNTQLYDRKNIPNSLV